VDDSRYLVVLVTLVVVYSLVGLTVGAMRHDEKSMAVDVDNIHIWSPGEYGLSDDFDFGYVDAPDYLNPGDDIAVHCGITWETSWKDVFHPDFFVMLKLYHFAADEWEEEDKMMISWAYGGWDTKQPLPHPLDGGTMGYYDYYFQIELNKGSLMDYETQEVYGGVIQGRNGSKTIPDTFHMSSGSEMRSILDILYKLVNPIEYNKLITDGMPGDLAIFVTLWQAVWTLAMIWIIWQFVKSHIPFVGD